MKKFIKLVPALALVCGLSSCLKDEAVIHNDGLRNIIEFQNVGSIKSGTSDIFPVYVPLTLLPDDPSAEFEGIVSYSGTDTAPQDIVVNIERSDLTITQFNAKTTGTKYNPIAASEVTHPTTVTIPKGQRQAKFKVTIKIPNLNKALSNAIAFKITSASTGTISGNFGAVIFSTPIKSIWEGTYTVTVHNNYGATNASWAGGPYSESDMHLSTIGPNQVQQTSVAAWYSGYTNYQFNGNNTGITSVVAFSGANLSTSVQGVDLIDPVTKNFTLRYTVNGWGLTETWVRTGD